MSPRGVRWRRRLCVGHEPSGPSTDREDNIKPQRQRTRASVAGIILTVSSSSYILTPFTENLRETPLLILHVWLWRGKALVRMSPEVMSTWTICLHSYFEGFQLSVQVFNLLIQTAVLHWERANILEKNQMRF